MGLEVCCGGELNLNLVLVQNMALMKGGGSLFRPEEAMVLAFGKLLPKK